MRSARYDAAFRELAIRQIVVHRYPVRQVAERFRVSSQSLYAWLAAAGRPRRKRGSGRSLDLLWENRQLKARLERIEEERDLLRRVLSEQFRRQSPPPGSGGQAVP